MVFILLLNMMLVSRGRRLVASPLQKILAPFTVFKRTSVICRVKLTLDTKMKRNGFLKWPSVFYGYLQRECELHVQ